MFKRVLSKLIIVSLLLTMIVPNFALSAGGQSLADDFAAKSSTQIVKKNLYDQDLLDVCYYPHSQAFFAVGNNGTMLVSTDGDSWGTVTDPDILSSTNVNFVDMYCASNQIAVVGQEVGTGNNYVFLKNNNDAFTKIDLTAVNNGSHNVQAVAISGTNIAVTTNTSSYYHSDDSGETWHFEQLNGSSTGASAIAVDSLSSSLGYGKFKVYNNNDDNRRTFDSQIGRGDWPSVGAPTRKFSTIKNLYRTNAEWVILWNDGNSSSENYNHRTDGSSDVNRIADYMLEAAYVTGNGLSILVGWKDDKMIIRSDKGTYSSNLHLYNHNQDSKHSWVGTGKLYGIDAGQLNGQMTYIAVGSNGSILKSKNGYEFAPVAPQVAVTEAKVKHLAVNGDWSGTGPGQQVVITEDNKVYYSEDGGLTWRYAHQVSLSGQVAGMQYINDGTKQLLYIATNDATTDTATSYQIAFPIVESTVPFTNFKISGVTKNNNGVVYYGTTPTTGYAVMASQYSYDKTFKVSTSNVSGDILSTLAVDNSIMFAFSGQNVHVVSLPNTNGSSPYTINSANGNGGIYSGEPKAFTAWATGNDRQILMNASGAVRVFTDHRVESMMFRDTNIYTGAGVPSSTFELSKLLFVNGLFAALGKDGSVYTSFDGIIWTYQADLSSADIVDIAKNDNSLLLLDKNNTVQTVVLSYNAWTSNTYVKYPNPTITAPPPPGPIDGTLAGVNLITVETANDLNATDTTPSYKWFVEDTNGTPQELSGETLNTFDLSELSAGINMVHVEVTYNDATKLDQPQSKRAFGPYGYDIKIPRYEVDVDYSAHNFTVVEGYNASEVTPITVTIENTGDTALSDLQISSSNASVVAGALSSSTVAVGASVTAQLTIAAGLTMDSYSSDITVSSATGNIQETQTISVNVTDVPRYELNGQVDRTSIQLAHDYASANDAKVTLTLDNTGNRDIETLTVTLSDTQNFELTTVPARIEIGDTETISITPKVTLQPGNNYSYVLTIESEATTITNTVTITVDETPRYDVTLTTVKNNVTISDDYTDVTRGELVVSIENSGNRDLNDLSVALQGADAGKFTLNAVSQNLPVGQSVSVIATPDANLSINEYNATLTVTAATYSINKSQALKLTVSDVPVYNVDLSLSTNSVDLSHGYTTIDGMITVTLHNNGNRDVVPTVSVSHPSVLTVGTIPASIAANESDSFELNVIENVAAGTYPVTLTVTSAAGTQTETITVDIEPAPLYQLSVTADRSTANLSLNYANASAGKFVLTARNDGNQSLQNISISASDTVNFTIGAIPTQLAVGEDATIEVTPIAGLAAGSYPVTVTISADQITDQVLTLKVVVASAPRPDPTEDDPTPDTTPDTTPVPVPNTGGNVEGALTNVTESTDASGASVVTQQVDEKKLEDQLETAPSGTTVVIAQTTNADIVKTELSGSLLQSLGNKQATIEIQTNSGTYKLPTDQLDLNVLAQQFGTGVAATDLQVTVNIAKSDAQTVQAVADAAQNGKVTLVVTPVEFSVTVSYNGQTHEVTQYSEYVAREIPIPVDVDPQSITTAAVLDKDGSLRSVPTTIVLRDGNYYAVIKSLTNSIYTLIHNEVMFDDVVGHWSDASVHDLANRLILHGMNEDTFGPDKEVTRAEFAAIVVRALGLPQNGSNAAYKDVQASDWYAGAVAKASEYRLISGYENGTFRPHATITREEAFAIIARAMKLAGLEVNVMADQASEILVAFEDGSTVSRWAAPSVATVVQGGIVQGSNAELRPTGNITRAETAAIVQRLLIQAGLIDN